MPTKEESLEPKAVAEIVVESLDDLKASDIICLDVRHLTTMMDYMVIASGRSDRHVRALADGILERCRQLGVAILGSEGEEAGEWILVDLADVVVHVMLPRTRDFYELEKLWDIAGPGGDEDRDRLRVQ